MLLGYARVSTGEQNVDLQIAALRKCGCDRIFLDEGISGKEISRPSLNQMLSVLRRDDKIIVWRLDRLSRSLSDLLGLIKELEALGAGFQSLTEQIDTSTPSGTLMFHMLGALAEFERALISERTKAGMRVAHLRGKTLGRPSSLSSAQIALAQQLTNEGQPMHKIARQFGVSRSTIYRSIAKHNAANENHADKAGGISDR
ncbi:Transposon DNA-invertase [Maritalea myrionectae]|uniref:Transposon DNA-invertase n=1 Tax=Maritalea myrionectae TaxID=454601 RepID=A0A2R4MEE7_9HYPH|nr:recombinase family protein [Maritalea myrionectae]AVX04266.1 Transposon DNA-invertase [Maritalea myrionectae]